MNKLLSTFSLFVLLFVSGNVKAQSESFQPLADGIWEQHVTVDIEENTTSDSVSLIYWEIRCYMGDHIAYVYANDSVEHININGISYTNPIYNTEYLFEGTISTFELPYWNTGLIKLPAPSTGKQLTVTIERRKIQSE